MNYQHYSPEFKAKIVLQVLQGEKEIGELSQEYSINPNLIRKWKTEFLEKAYFTTVWEERKIFLAITIDHDSCFFVACPGKPC